MIRFAWPMVRHHLAAYSSVLITVILGSALAGSSVGAFVTILAAPGLPPVSARTPEMRNALEASSSLWGTGMIITVFIMAFLVSSTMAFTLSARRRELALLRLTGATSAQLRRLTRSEAFIVGITGSSIGAALTIPGTILLQRLSTAMNNELMLSEMENAPLETMRIVIMVTIALGVVVTLAGAWIPTRRIAKLPPLDAIVAAGTRKRTMTVSRWIVSTIGILGALAMLWITPPTADDAAVTLLGICALLIVSLAILGPVIVPPLASLICAVAVKLWSGAGFLAKAHCLWNTDRTSTLAAPPLLLVGLLGGSLITIETMSGGEALRNPLNIQALLALFGGSTLFAMLNCVLTILSSARERRGEFSLLQTAGATRGQVISTILVETCVILATSALLLTIVLGFASVRMIQVLQNFDSPLPLNIPLSVLGLLFGLCVIVSFVAALGGGFWATRSWPNRTKLTT